jgi:hypothetical protein
MPPDRKEPGATWQGPVSRVNSSADQYDGVNNSVDPVAPSPEEAEYNVPGQQSGWPNAASAQTPQQTYEDGEPIDSPSLLQNLRQHLFLILLPLLFALLTSLITLPAIANEQAQLAPTAFWPVLLVIVAIAVALGLFIYFTTNQEQSIRIAGFENGRWIPAAIVAFCIFLVIVGTVFFGLLPGLFILLAFVLIGVVLFFNYRYEVPTGVVALVYAFKKYRRTLEAGVHILLPWEKVRTTLRVTQVMWMCPPQIVQLSRDEDVSLRAVITYQLVPEDAYLAVTQVSNWEESLKLLLSTTLQSIADLFVPQDFLPWAPEMYEQNNSSNDSFMGGSERRAHIETTLLNRVRDRAALWGVQIVRVEIRDIEIMAHEARATETQKPNEAPSIPSTSSTPATSATPQPTTVLSTPTQTIPPVATVPQTPPAPTMQAQKTGPSAKEERAQPEVASRPAVQPTPQTVQRPHIPQVPATQLHYATPNETTEETPQYSAQSLSEDVLTKAYKAVQNEQVTDPAAIREIAMRFEAVARDPKLSQSMNFDPARAALNLYDQARLKEEQINEAHNSGAQPDWIARQPNDDNMMVGG